MLCIQLHYRHVYSSGISQGHRLCSQDVKGPRDTCIDRDKMIDKQQLISELNYCQETGIFTWKKYKRGVNKSLYAGSICHNGYLKIFINNKHYYAHRLAWLYTYGYMPDREVDHINHDKSDNRISNLRLATRNQNSFNTSIRSDNTSGIKGVSWYPRLNKWRVYINANNKQKTIGYFEELELAELVIYEARKKYHGHYHYNG
jgi:hypothetical protein